MATGLKTFDDFTWASLLKGRETLVVDRNAARGRRTAAALEEAGALVTLAFNQATGADRARDQTFRLAVIGLTADEALGDRLATGIVTPQTQCVLLAETVRHVEFRAAFPTTRIGDHTMSDRDLVMFIIGTPDE